MSSAATSPLSPRSPFLVAADLLDPPPDPYVQDPVGFARDVLGFTAWSKQQQIMESVRDHQRTAVRSCHGIGKTADAAQIVLWFLATRRNSRVITTAPTWAQVIDMLWREIRAAVGRAHDAGRADIFKPPTTAKLELGDEWFAVGWSTDRPERFQGHHADHLLLVVDEASGVDEQIFEAAEGFLTAQGAHVLLIGNPTRVGGQFHRAFTTERTRWNQIHVSVYDSPNYIGHPRYTGTPEMEAIDRHLPADVLRSLPRKEWADEVAEAWGRDSPMFHVRALGEFPARGENTIVPLDAVEAAQLRKVDADPQVDRITVACDVARYGSDETVIGTRIGRRLRIAEEGIYRGRSLTETAGAVLREAKRYPAPAVTIVIDDDGLGGGVTDILRDDPWVLAHDVQVVAFKAGEQAYDPEHYANRKTELWFTMQQRIAELDLDEDDQLAADLTAPTYRLDSRGRFQVESKDDTKKRIGRSPDRGDMAVMTLVKPPAIVIPDRAPAPVGHGLPMDSQSRSSGTLTGDLRDERW